MPLNGNIGTRVQNLMLSKRTTAHLQVYSICKSKVAIGRTTRKSNIGILKQIDSHGSQIEPRL